MGCAWVERGEISICPALRSVPLRRGGGGDLVLDGDAHAVPERA